MNNMTQQVSDLRQTALPFNEDMQSTPGCFPVPDPASSFSEVSGERAPTDSELSRQLSDINPEGIFSITLGLDLGFSTTGFAVCDNKNSRILAWGEMDHRNRNETGGVPERMSKRSELRRTRRSRKWNRPARFDNRKRGEDWMQPTMESHLAAHLKLVRFLLKRYNIDSVVVEAGQFDMHAMKEGVSALPNWAYQKGELYQYENIKAYIRDRDNYTCQYCGTKAGVMTVDHILPQSRYPDQKRNTKNMVCACKKCNIEKGKKTAAEYGYPQIQEKVTAKDRRYLRAATGMNHLNKALLLKLCQGDLYLSSNDNKSKIDVAVQETFGFITKADREALGLQKTHYCDAAVIASKGKKAETPDKYMNMRWMGRPVRKATKEQKKKGGVLERRVKNKSLTVNNTTFFAGDYVEYRGENKTVKGFIQSLMSKGSAKVTGVSGASDIKGTWSLKKIRKLASKPRLRYEMRLSVLENVHLGGGNSNG